MAFDLGTPNPAHPGVFILERAVRHAEKACDHNDPVHARIAMLLIRHALPTDVTSVFNLNARHWRVMTHHLEDIIRASLPMPSDLDIPPIPTRTPVIFASPQKC